MCNGHITYSTQRGAGGEASSVVTTVASTAGADKEIASCDAIVLLSTAIAYITGADGQRRTCRILLDCASTSNFISEDLVNELKLNKRVSDISIYGIGSNNSRAYFDTTVTIQSRFNAFKKTINCTILPKITGSIPNVTFDPSILKIPHEIQLADDSFYESTEVKMLVGAAEFWQILHDERRSLGRNKPILQNSQLGWIICGPLLATRILPKAHAIANCALSDQLTKFWNIEEVNEPQLSHDEKLCEQHFLKNTKRETDGRFIVSIPFLENVEQLGESRNGAFRSFLSLEKRLIKNDDLRKEYNAFLREYEQLQHMTEIDESGTLKYNYYLPHHPVIKDSSITTRLRVVFNGSATTTTGLSLNDVQMTGSTLQSDLFAILLRFRKHEIVISGDICKMFRQILINKDQRGCQRVLWRTDPAQDLRCFTLNTVTYGFRSSSFLATRCLKQLSDDNKMAYPEASRAIAEDMYVDDLLTGADTLTEATILREQIDNILKSAQFQLRKWASNVPQAISNNVNDNDNCLKFFPIQEHNENKTLGVLWNPADDFLQYQFKHFNENEIITKRSMLSAISQVYDPIGLLSPYTIVAKMTLQGLWKSKLNWDEPVDTVLREQWLLYLQDMQELNSLKISRRVMCSQGRDITLHSFSDASERGYGCCIYLKSTSGNGDTTVNLLCAKSKVAPVKNVTIARLELLAALLSARLVKRVKETMHMNIQREYYWCDSTIVLCWINAEPNKWKTFVANRISEIQSLTRTKDWYHIKSKENAADILSRGATAEQLLNSDIWWHGPQIIRDEITAQSYNAGFETDVPERRSTELSLVSTQSTFDLWSKYSSLGKLLRIVAYCKRFANNSKRGVYKQHGQLTTNEIQHALNNLIRLAQSQSLSNELLLLAKRQPLGLKNRLTSLSPFIDGELIRVGGRLMNAEISYDEKHPIILPAKHPFTTLIAREMHERNLHCGPGALLSFIRQKYWPVNGRNLVRKVVHDCVICFRAKPRQYQHQMGQLPGERINPSPAFYNTGCDYLGPVQIRDKKGRGCKTIKAYVCVFVCFSTKAIHLELVGSLTTEAFIAALRRFVARRGAPNKMHSDNATNFKGARNELSELKEFLERDNTVTQVNKFMAEREILWEFIPPRAPHFGGLWESAVKSIKFHLKRVYDCVDSGRSDIELKIYPHYLPTRTIIPINLLDTRKNRECPSRGGRRCASSASSANVRATPKFVRRYSKTQRVLAGGICYGPARHLGRKRQSTKDESVRL